MNKRTRVIVLAALVVLVAVGANAGKEVAYDETFAVEPGGKLDLEVDDMDVEIAPGTSNEAHVIVTLSGDLDDARERFEDSHFTAKVRGNTLVIETDRPRHGWSWSWSSSRVDIHVAVTVPKKFDVRAQSSDGDLTANGIEGEIDLKTSDGDVELDGLKGAVTYVKTSDGDITARELDVEDIDLRTSDGDIKAVSIKSQVVSFSTSDGNVDADELEAESISARTSDGDLDLNVSGRELKARTSDGDIDVRVADKMALDLTASDGDITIRAPSGYGADVDLKGEYVSLGGKVTIEGEVTKRRVSGILGDGGPKVRARTSDGSVSFRFY